MNRRLLAVIPSALLVLLVLTLDAHSRASAQGSVSGPGTQTGQKVPVPSQYEGAATAAQAPLAPVGSGFTYQGRLTNGGNPATGSYDFQFTLYDASSGGNLAGGPLTVLAQTVSSGLFTVSLDFGQNAFQGSARCLEIAVRQAGGGSYTTLSPRQPLTAAPYALSLMPGTVITGTIASSPILSVTNTSVASSAIALSGNTLCGTCIGVKGSGGTGVYGTGGTGVFGVDTSNSGTGVIGQSSGTGTGVRGIGGLYGVVGSGTSAGVSGTSNDPNGYGVQGTVQSGTGNAGVYGLSNSTNGSGVMGRADSGTNAVGVNGISANGYGVYGNGGSTGVFGSGTTYGVRGSTSNSTGYGVSGLNTAINGTAILGSAPNGTASTGVYGSAPNGTGVFGTGSTGINGSGTTYGVFGTGSIGMYGSGSTGMYGSGSSYGVYGTSGNTGVYGTGYYGVYGSGSGSEAAGVYGEGVGSGYGVHGHTATGYTGVWGDSTGTSGVGVTGYADGSSAVGVYGRSNGNTGVYGTGYWGVYGSGGFVGVYATSSNGNSLYVAHGGPGYTAYIDGDTSINGNLDVSGSCCLAERGTYRIDDPLDPADKYINQAAVESQDMLTILSGNVTTDAQGNGTVTLPAYFQATNRDFRYQLTVIGQFAQAIISSELKDNHFTIQTDKPSIKVSWQVTGVRDDPYARDHPITPEQDKPSNETGTYLYPKGYNQPDSKSVDYEQRQKMEQRARQVQQAGQPSQPTPPNGK